MKKTLLSLVLFLATHENWAADRTDNPSRGMSALDFDNCSYSSVSTLRPEQKLLNSDHQAMVFTQQGDPLTVANLQRHNNLCVHSSKRSVMDMISLDRLVKNSSTVRRVHSMDSGIDSADAIAQAVLAQALREQAAMQPRSPLSERRQESSVCCLMFLWRKLCCLGKSAHIHGSVLYEGMLQLGIPPR